MSVLRFVFWIMSSEVWRSSNLPPQLDKFTQMKDGLVLVTGPTGSGKSTTLASIIDKINRTRADHIITVEDPIEYVHTNKKSLIHQARVIHGRANV